VKQTSLATIVALLFGAAVLAGDQHGKSKKHSDAKETAAHADRDGGSGVAVHVSWTSHDIEIVRRHYAPKYRNLPPGLQKKYARTGKLPPGWQKKMEPFPVALERECAPLPSGYRRGVIDANAVIYNSRGVIIDVTVLF
jgi:hypothetical protein